MKKKKDPFNILADVIELYIPMAAFLLLFTSFILQIVSRYIFRSPLVWPYELSQIAYLWTILLGASFAARTNENIVFSLVHDAAPPKVQRIFDIISDVLTVVLFGMMIPASIEFYRFYMTRYSAVFDVQLGIVYFAFVPFVIFTILRSLSRLTKCWKKIEPAEHCEEGKS
jgi:TRAP-type C4-dicarboxylate transport system permease small subunit